MTDVDLTRRPLEVVADPLTNPEPVTSLDQISDMLGEIDLGTIMLAVDARPGFTVEYSLKMDSAKVTAWRVGCKEPLAPTGYNEFQFFQTVLAGQCKRITVNGSTLVDPKTQRPVTFTSPDLAGMLKIPAGAPGAAVEAVKRFYVNEFAVQAAYEMLTDKAGLGKTATEVEDHPTSGLSGL
jgi:hypothetical protein